MKSVTDVRSLQDLRTATTRRIRARPPQKGMAPLNMYLLSTEKLRLEQELTHVEKRRTRLLTQRGELVQQLLKLQQVVREETMGGMPPESDEVASSDRKASSPPQGHGPWRTMAAPY